MFSSKWRIGLALLVCLMAWPSMARAQSAISGLVRDTSGAVLPGVTVEASSPALIEKTRSVVTDGEGRYQIVDLRPGVYTITAQLEGFSVSRRDDTIEFRWRGGTAWLGRRRRESASSLVY